MNSMVDLSPPSTQGRRSAIDRSTLEALGSFPKRLRDFYVSIPARFRHWSPEAWDGIPSEPFNALEQICHVRDIEIDGYQPRIRRVLDETSPFLASVDGARLARERNYANEDSSPVLETFAATRAHTLTMIVNLSNEDFERTATLEGYGRVTLRALVHYLCSHDQQHLAGLQWLLGKIAADVACSA
jgi:hypothetical protein